MRILILHNRYRQAGGEDVFAAGQARLFREKGHEVRVVEKDNREIDGYGLFGKAALFFRMTRNDAAASEVAVIVKEFSPHVAHVHNTLPLLSPAIYAPLKKAGVPIIQTLQNYRLLCPAGTLFRDGAPCRLCIDDGLGHAVKHRCWSHSTMATLGLTRMLDRHRRAGTWSRGIDLYVASNRLQKELLVENKIVPEERIIVQPNFAYVDADKERTDAIGDGFLFLGRLTPEKGIKALLTAAANLKDVPITILGDGPMRGEVEAACQNTPNLSYRGQQPRDEAIRQLRSTRALIFPSEWQEGCPFTIIEAMAMGRAVIASRVAGAMELVVDGETGLVFEPGDANSLAACVKRLHEDAGLAEQLGRAARERYERECSPEAGYRRMREAWKKAGVGGVD